MKERSVHSDMAFPAHHQAAKISQPGEYPLHLPPTFIASQLAAVLQRRALAVGTMRTDQLDPSLGQALAQRIRVTGFIIAEACRPFTRTPTTTAGHRDGLQRWLPQLPCGGGRRVQEVSHRNTFTVDHHHPLRACAPFGLANAGPL